MFDIFFNEMRNITMKELVSRKSFLIHYWFGVLESHSTIQRLLDLNQNTEQRDSSNNFSGMFCNLVCLNPTRTSICTCALRKQPHLQSSQSIDQKKQNLFSYILTYRNQCKFHPESILHPYTLLYRVLHNFQLR
jgi:hypothetical protein